MSTPPIRLLAAREVRERLRSKAFLASTAFTLLIVTALAVLPGVLGDDGPTTYDIGVAGAAADEIAVALPPSAARLDEVEVEVRHLEAGAGERLVEEGELDAVVIDGEEVVVDEALEGDLALLISDAAADVASRDALADAGVSGDEAAAALHPEPLDVRAIDPPDAEQDDRNALVAVGTFLLYGQLFGFGFWVASGLVEEKSSRVAELLLTKASPSQVLAGKVVGLGILGFGQLLVIVAVGLAAAVAAGTVDLPPGTPAAVAMVLGWFIPGYVFYSCLFAVGGALASRAEELQATTMPVMMVVIASFVAAVSVAGDPGGTLARVVTLVPSAAPLVLPIRHAHGELAWWEMAASLAIMLAATVAVVRLAARAHAGAALNVRGTLKLREALRRAE